jgi:hypothetical protein
MFQCYLQQIFIWLYYIKISFNVGKTLKTKMWTNKQWWYIDMQLSFNIISAKQICLENIKTVCFKI